MIFRKAGSNDAEKITPFLMLAMKDIVYRFIGEESEVKAQQFLTDLIAQKANQYSHENCWIVELNDEIAAVAVVYDGAKLHELRMPVASYIKAQFDRDFTPEDETQSGEYAAMEGDKEILGYEFLPNKYFFTYTPPPASDLLLQEFWELEKEAEQILSGMKML